MTEDIAWAINKVNAYQYRKEFSLSYQEFLEEPLDEYRVNLAIMSMIEEAKKKELEKQKRRVKK